MNLLHIHSLHFCQKASNLLITNLQRGRCVLQLKTQESPLRFDLASTELDWVQNIPISWFLFGTEPTLEILSCHQSIFARWQLNARNLGWQINKMSKSFWFCSDIGNCQCTIMECICAMVLSIVLRTIATTLAKAPGPVAQRNEKSRVLPEWGSVEFQVQSEYHDLFPRHSCYIRRLELIARELCTKFCGTGMTEFRKYSLQRPERGGRWGW